MVFSSKDGLKINQICCQNELIMMLYNFFTARSWTLVYAVCLKTFCKLESGKYAKLHFNNPCNADLTTFIRLYIYNINTKQQNPEYGNGGRRGKDNDIGTLKSDSMLKYYSIILIKPSLCNYHQIGLK